MLFLIITVKINTIFLILNSAVLGEAYIGANDVVNPVAHNNPEIPIFGMLILDVENAKHIVVNKRSMNAGYAGIENELFYNSKTSMLFGDAKAALTDLVSELKNM